MPEKGGIDVLKEIGKEKAKTVIVVSALGQENFMTEAMNLGACAFIVKPFDEKKVIETVKNTLHL
jgi:two-component system chemotaxis response regulator CheY